MEDEADLPLTYEDYELPTQQRVQNSVLPSRKHPREYDPTFSSDPAFFSSDDFLDTSAEDYLQVSHKKRYRGTWWNKESLEEAKTEGQRAGKREFKRNLDSGIWVDEDDIPDQYETSFGPTLALQPEASRTDPIVSRPDEQSGLIRIFWPGDEAVVNSAEVQDAAAAKIVEQCVDKGDQCVDLSGQGLQVLNDWTLYPLRHLIPDRGGPFLPVAGLAAYSPFVQDLHIYLYNNHLRSLPSELFNLEHLSVLSLRNNELTELPSTVEKLWNLKELNLSGNEFRYLPWEILELIRTRRLRTLSLGTNPLVQIDDTLMRDSTHQKTGGVTPSVHVGPATTRMPKFLAATVVSFLNANSTRHRASPDMPSVLARSEGRLPAAPSNYTPLPPDCSQPSFTPSLIELALRSCAKSQYLGQLVDMLPSDCPGILCRLIKETETSRYMGGRKCSVCGKAYILARTEWIEWWDYHGQLPLLRNGCSWQCVPKSDR